MVAKTYKKLIKFLSSKTFFGLILAIFIFSTGWMAVSARYPMAFDEDYHLGLIKLHSQQWSPIFTEQPAGMAQYSQLTRDPSYLYQYLMSFPYRLLESLNVSFTVLVVSLRFINIALFLASLLVFRRLLLKTRASPAVVHCAMLFFVLTPVVPLLAAHINYDNLQILLIAWAMLLTVRLQQSLTKGKPDFSALFVAWIVCLLGSLVKFSFLPILTAVVVYDLFLIVRYSLKRRARLISSFKKYWLRLGWLLKSVLFSCLFLSIGLWVSMYGVNIVKYYNPAPQCHEVLTVERCSAYAPWHRNYQAYLNNKHDQNPVYFMVNWFGGMFNRLFFTINGHGKFADNTNYMAPIMAAAAAIITLIGSLLLILHGRALLKDDPAMVCLIFICLVYIVSVWGRNINDYYNLGKIVAINGRYLVMVILPLYLLIAKAYQYHFAKQQKTKLVIFSLALLMFLQGGGVVSFIYYSDSRWYWPRNQFVDQINTAAKNVVRPLFVSRDFPYHIDR